MEQLADSVQYTTGLDLGAVKQYVNSMFYRLHRVVRDIRVS